MRLGARSLSEDRVDVFTNFWSVLFFLFLALVALFVPGPEQRYEANCWCPSQADPSQVKYANMMCAIVYNNLKLEGVNPSMATYPLPRFEGSRDTGYDNDRDKEKDEPKPERDGVTKKPFHLQSPYILFLFAAGLMLPRLLWSIVSDYFSSVNVGQTLKSAERGGALDVDGRRQTFTALVQAFTKYTQNSPKTATCLYMFMKMLVIVVLVAELLVVNIYIIPKLCEPTESERSGESDTVTSSRSRSFTAGAPSAGHDQSYDIFHCTYTIWIKESEMFHDYTHQCLVKERKDSIILPSHSTLNWNVYFITNVSLSLLLALNLLTACGWLIWLAGGSKRSRLGISDLTCPLDLIFLIQMARTNLSVAVAIGLAESVRADVHSTNTGENKSLSSG